MDEKQLKLLGALVALGIFVCAIIVVIDLKIKNDLVQLAMQTDRDLMGIRNLAKEAGVIHEQKANGSSEVGAWAVRGVPNHIHGRPVFRSNARMEATGPDSPPLFTAEEAQPTESPAGNADQGIQESN